MISMDTLWLHGISRLWCPRKAVRLNHPFTHFPVFIIVSWSQCFNMMHFTETKMSSFWWNFHHWLHRKLSFWQLLVQPVMKISSKWRHFRFSVLHYHIGLSLTSALVSLVITMTLISLSESCLNFICNKLSFLPLWLQYSLASIFRIQKSKIDVVPLSYLVFRALSGHHMFLSCFINITLDLTLFAVYYVSMFSVFFFIITTIFPIFYVSMRFRMNAAISRF